MGRLLQGKEGGGDPETVATDKWAGRGVGGGGGPGAEAGGGGTVEETEGFTGAGLPGESADSILHHVQAVVPVLDFVSDVE